MLRIMMMCVVCLYMDGVDVGVDVCFITVCDVVVCGGTGDVVVSVCVGVHTDGGVGDNHGVVCGVGVVRLFVLVLLVLMSGVCVGDVVCVVIDMWEYGVSCVTGGTGGVGGCYIGGVVVIVGVVIGGIGIWGCGCGYVGGV